MPPALNPKSYGRARVLEAPSRPKLVIGRSFYKETREEAETAEEAETEEAETAREAGTEAAACYLLLSLASDPLEGILVQQIQNFLGGWRDWTEWQTIVSILEQVN